MVQGNNIQAEIDIPDVVHIPPRRKVVEVAARVSLVNSGEEDFVAHAESRDEATFWHVFNADFREITREKGRGKGGHLGPRVLRGVHSYRTVTVPAGGTVNDNRTLKLDATKLKAGETYNVRGEIYGHLAEASFVAVPEAGGALGVRKTPTKPKAAKKTAKKTAKKS